MEKARKEGMREAMLLPRRLQHREHTALAVAIVIVIDGGFTPMRRRSMAVSVACSNGVGVGCLTASQLEEKSAKVVVKAQEFRASQILYTTVAIDYSNTIP